MQTMQERILARITQAATAAGFEVSKQEQWANTGTVFFLRKGETEPIGKTTYNFQDDRYNLTVTWCGKRIPSQEGRADYFDFYQTYEERSRFWQVLEGKLNEGRRGVPK